MIEDAQELNFFAITRQAQTARAKLEREVSQWRVDSLEWEELHKSNTDVIQLLQSKLNQANLEIARLHQLLGTSPNHHRYYDRNVWGNERGLLNKEYIYIHTPNTSPTEEG